MKAAIVEQAGRKPVYGDFEEPVPSAGENRIAVAAAALSPVVKARASGTHYSSSGDFPIGVGIDGVLPHICEAVLNHLPPKLVRTYNQNTYENEKRKALDTWAHHLKTIVAQASGANITALKKKQR